MNSDASEDASEPRGEDNGAPGLRTLFDAKAWLAKMAKNGASRVEIKEPYRVIGGGLLVVTASLVREDGARVNIEVYCYDDRELRPGPHQGPGPHWTHRGHGLHGEGNQIALAPP